MTLKFRAGVSKLEPATYFRKQKFYWDTVTPFTYMWFMATFALKMAELSG